ncbi:RidA family protein [Aliihoeflea aestuarii]|jgi:enamine deaminase RidA (YjgF/YER057c/UK114 family)|uniref:RidA family protein n=1 Tax=Aliihoeflea aestuarii TaxID=453840 RepID=UPI0020939307|nr:RidA family protein [Aliihoeflea aestuarii]MCO6391692.1 RidA family protein [Aliihoeflea aestuarii]
MTAPVHEILHPANWKKASGYANGVAAKGRTIYVGGQIGWNGDQVFEVQDLVGQTRQTLQNIVDILAEAGAGPQHLTRMTWYVTDKRAYLDNLKGIGAAYREVIGRNFPAMAMVQVVALIEDDAKVEIEATAVLPD